MNDIWTLSDFFWEEADADIRTVPGRIQDRVLTWTFCRYARDLSALPGDYDDFSLRFLRRGEELHGQLAMLTPLSSRAWKHAVETLREKKTGIALNLDALVEDRGVQRVPFLWDMKGNRPEIWTQNQFAFLCQAADASYPFRATFHWEGMEFSGVDRSYLEKIRMFPLPVSRWIKVGEFHHRISWEDIDQLGNSGLR